MSHTTAEEVTIRVRGLNVAARIWGPPCACPVLALHGWLDNAASFDALAPLIPNCRIVAVDLPGHGLSAYRPKGALYHYADWVIDVTAISEVLNWDCFAIMGHSMGAGIACLFAGTFPKRVNSLVLLDGLGPMTAGGEEAPERMFAGVRRLLSIEQRKRPKPLPSRQFAAARMCEAVPGLTLKSAHILLERGMKDVDGGVVWRADPRLRVPSLFRFTQTHVRAFLKRISCPVLIVRGENGFPFDKNWVDEQLASLKNVHVVSVKGGHHVHLDKAESIAPSIYAHLASSCHQLTL